jgi:hypothetical protein
MINDLKDLKALFKLCRAQGITTFKMNGIEVNFGELPTQQQASYNQETAEEAASPYANFPDRILTPEELIFYSSGGRPEDAPENKEAI